MSTPLRALVASLLLTVTFCAPNAVLAQTSTDERIQQLEDKLDRSLKLIEQLNARVKELESERAGATAQVTPPPSGPSAAPAAAPVVAPGAAQPAGPPEPMQQRLDSLEQQLAQVSAANAAHSSGLFGVPLHAFADVAIGNHTAYEPGLKGANIGALDMYLNPQIGDHTRALFELAFEVDEAGQVEPDLERAQIGYQFSDAATVWIGRFHTPFGYYNTAFHHGQEIATSLRRPRMVAFEDQGGILPNHTVGAWLNGAVRLDDGRVTYDAFIGNGQRIIDGTIDPRSGGLDFGGAIFGGNLGYVFGEPLSGLKVGISGFRSRVTDDTVPGRITQVDNLGVYFDYDTDRFEHIGELYRFNNRDWSAGGPGHSSTAGFLQLAMRWPLFTPYVRYERAALDQTDNYFALQDNGSSYYRFALGLRFDVDSRSALKLEFAHTKNTDRIVDSWNDALLDYAIRF